MRYHSQNLNERNGVTNGSMLWNGRAWIYLTQRREIHWEWAFGKHARSFRFGIDFGHGDGDDGVLFAACVPFLFSIYFGVDGVWRCKKPFETGISIHDNSIWIKFITWSNEWSRNDPWYRKTFSWSFPWDYRHHTTEILEHKANIPGLAKSVFTDVSRRRNNGQRFLKTFETRKTAEKSVSDEYPYSYTLKSGEVQLRRATVHVDRMTWRMRWWPLLPFKKIRTSINIQFNEEVGEGTGSWKGGCTGCGYEMKFGETPLETLQRMERERKFNR